MEGDEEGLGIWTLVNGPRLRGHAVIGSGNRRQDTDGKIILRDQAGDRVRARSRKGSQHRAELSQGKEEREGAGLGDWVSQGQVGGPGWAGGRARGPGRQEAGDRFNKLADPFVPPDSYIAALCPQPRPHTVYS